MRTLYILFLILSLASIACGATAIAVPTSPPQPTSTLSLATQANEQFLDLATVTTTLEPATATSTPSPAGMIFVDTLEQEVYPFNENGKCSLAEAIFAANSAKPKDTCVAGGEERSVIVLMPGIYHFTQADHTPQQGEWAYSTRTIGNGLPAVIRTLTIRGNDATLLRDNTQEQFRFLEVLSGTLTLQDLTLQGGDVGDDWGGGIYSFNASIIIDNVYLSENHADNGGGLYLDFGALTITNSQFDGNKAEFAGAGLYMTSARADIRSSQFFENSAGGEGGGLFAEGVTLSVGESLFLKNQADGTRGGAFYVKHVNMTISHSQFYQNWTAAFGGAMSITNPVVIGSSEAEGDPMDNLSSNPMLPQLQTLVPGLEATLQANPSGVYQELVEDAQIHDSCIVNNVNPSVDKSGAAVVVGDSHAENNYWGDPTGPSGLAPGNGDPVAKYVVYAPFLKEAPSYCDLSLLRHN